jgi:N-acetylglucosamine-6-phosphate deacetylase
VCDIGVESGRIAAIGSLDGEGVDFGGARIFPGLIDIHSHGCIGIDTMDAEKLGEMADWELEQGVTTWYPTTMTMDVEAVAAATSVDINLRHGASIPGFHMEGPFINVKCCGAQNPDHVRKPSIKEVKEIASIYPVKMISYAVETEGGAAFAKDCIKAGVVPSCGHTAAKMKDLEGAYKKGLRHMTHFCNQMTPLHHREIGMVGAGFLIEDLNTEVICDKIHLCPDMLRLVFTRRNLAHVQMITDSLRCSHCKDGYAFTMGGLEVKLENGEARLVKGGNLAGSTLWMGNGLKNVHEITGIALKDLVRTTSWNQAIELGLGDTLGKIEKGYTADIVVINKKSWKPLAVFVDGNKKI